MWVKFFCSNIHVNRSSCPWNIMLLFYYIVNAEHCVAVYCKLVSIIASYGVDVFRLDSKMDSPYKNTTLTQRDPDIRTPLGFRLMFPCRMVLVWASDSIPTYIQPTYVSIFVYVCLWMTEIFQRPNFIVFWLHIFHIWAWRSDLKTESYHYGYEYLRSCNTQERFD